MWTFDDVCRATKWEIDSFSFVCFLRFACMRRYEPAARSLSIPCDMTQRACVLRSQSSRLRRKIQLSRQCLSHLHTDSRRNWSQGRSAAFSTCQMPSSVKYINYIVGGQLAQTSTYSIITFPFRDCRRIVVGGSNGRSVHSAFAIDIRENQTSSAALHKVPCASSGAKCDYFYHLSSSSDPNEATKSISHIFP